MQSGKKEGAANNQQKMLNTNSSASFDGVESGRIDAGHWILNGWSDGRMFFSDFGWYFL